MTKAAAFQNRSKALTGRQSKVSRLMEITHPMRWRDRSSTCHHPSAEPSASGKRKYTTLLPFPAPKNNGIRVMERRPWAFPMFATCSHWPWPQGYLKGRKNTNTHHNINIHNATLSAMGTSGWLRRMCHMNYNQITAGHAGTDNLRLAVRPLRYASVGNRAEHTKFETTGSQATTEYHPRTRCRKNQTSHFEEQSRYQRGNHTMYPPRHTRTLELRTHDGSSIPPRLELPRPPIAARTRGRQWNSHATILDRPPTTMQCRHPRICSC